jgi:hypothetical protein
MQDRSPVYRWAPAAFGLLIAVVVGLSVGIWAYNLGLAHGIAEQVPPPPAGFYPWAYYHPWGFGPFFPLLFLLFWFFALRFFIRGGRSRGGWRGYYDLRSRDVPPMFEEWHRRAHEHDSRTAPPAPPAGT